MAGTARVADKAGTAGEADRGSDADTVSEPGIAGEADAAGEAGTACSAPPQHAEQDLSSKSGKALVPSSAPAKGRRRGV